MLRYSSFVLLVFLVVSSCKKGEEEMTDAQEVKITLLRSWEEKTRVETKWIQIPKKVPKDRLVATQRDRKLKLWLDCHIGSEKIKTYEKIGHYRLSPLRQFQKEENLS
jgi:hypothetical protein